MDYPLYIKLVVDESLNYSRHFSLLTVYLDKLKNELMTLLYQIISIFSSLLLIFKGKHFTYISMAFKGISMSSVKI